MIAKSHTWCRLRDELARLNEVKIPEPKSQILKNKDACGAPLLRLRVSCVSRRVRWRSGSAGGMRQPSTRAAFRNEACTLPRALLTRPRRALHAGGVIAARDGRRFGHAAAVRTTRLSSSEFSHSPPAALFADARARAQAPDARRLRGRCAKACGSWRLRTRRGGAPEPAAHVARSKPNCLSCSFCLHSAAALSSAVHA